MLLRDVRVPLEEVGRDPRELAARHLGVPRRQVGATRIVRRALDARRGRPRFSLHLEATFDTPARLPKGVEIAPGPIRLPPAPQVPGQPEVAVVGSGPAGLLAAWRLVQAGLRPTILERGPGFPARHEKVAALQASGRLDPEANFHYGFGGAGTYSDGKLTTRLGRPAVRTVLQVLQAHGAGSADEILVEAHPHVGTDRWPVVLEALRAELEQAGCHFSFNTRVTGLRSRGGRLTGLDLADGGLDCRAVLLAPGNSARELFAGLAGAGLAVSPKAFAVGVRMTHPQALIDRIQYGRAAGHPALGPATYRLVGRAAGRGVYSFCMCPGGTVVPTPTEPDRLAVNGMSNSGRDSGEGNAAIVVQVGRADFESDEPLAGVELQRTIEERAFEAGGGDYHAPAQTLLDFLEDRPTKILPAARYRPGLRSTRLADLFPKAVAGALREGLAAFCHKMPGLADPTSVLIGAETRTSCPVRIERGPDGCSLGTAGLFPAGEGAGYAGGIVSSAVDGIRQADALIAWLLEGHG